MIFQKQQADECVRYIMSNWRNAIHDENARITSADSRKQMPPVYIEKGNKYLFLYGTLCGQTLPIMPDIEQMFKSEHPRFDYLKPAQIHPQTTEEERLIQAALENFTPRFDHYRDKPLQIIGKIIPLQKPAFKIAFVRMPSEGGLAHVDVERFPHLLKPYI